jgi:hypothetical protein
MADWLAYGLEIAYADSREIGIVRQARTNSGLIRAQVANDSEYPDWPQAAREVIAAQHPKFVVMMVGVNDRKQIREQVAPPQPVAKLAPEPADKAALEPDRSAPDRFETPAAASPETTFPGGNRAVEFRTDTWSEAYIRRIDNTIASLKTSGVPVFWVGLPPLREDKSALDIPFLNELYRSRADKAVIVFIDVWDGFVDEDGRYAQFGPDVEGQTRRLRTNDGVYFTNAGARKLAHYVEREIERWLPNRSRRRPRSSHPPAPDRPACMRDRSPGRRYRCTQKPEARPTNSLAATPRSRRSTRWRRRCWRGARRYARRPDGLTITRDAPRLQAQPIYRPNYRWPSAMFQSFGFQPFRGVPMSVKGVTSECEATRPAPSIGSIQDVWVCKCRLQVV